MVAKTVNKNYVPLDILKKESRNGYNITSDYDVASIIDRINSDILNNQYEIWDYE